MVLMPTFGARRAVVALAACLLLLTHCGDEHFNKSAEMEKIRKTIAAIPAWADLQGIGETQQAALDQCFQEVAKYDTQMIRETVLDLVAELEAQRTYSNGEKSRLLILNRLVFKVPETGPRDGRYRGWDGAPASTTGVQLLWPLEEKEGKLKLLAPPGPARAGFPTHTQRYEAAAEFDYFAEHFPRRRILAP
jgi:hypothetical protein